MNLFRLIAEARVLAGGAHQCAALGHVWKTTGGRMCPRGDQNGGGPCSQAIYECESCGQEDYGEPGGPGFRDCYVLGPCDSRVAQPQPATHNFQPGVNTDVDSTNR